VDVWYKRAWVAPELWGDGRVTPFSPTGSTCRQARAAAHEAAWGCRPYLGTLFFVEGETRLAERDATGPHLALPADRYLERVAPWLSR